MGSPHKINTEVGVRLPDSKGTAAPAVRPVTLSRVQGKLLAGSCTKDTEVGMRLTAGNGAAAPGLQARVQ